MPEVRATRSARLSKGVNQCSEAESKGTKHGGELNTGLCSCNYVMDSKAGWVLTNNTHSGSENSGHSGDACTH